MGNGLFRDPAEWARDWGWISRRRAVNLAAKLHKIADCVGDEYPATADELRSIAKTLAPARVPAERKRLRREAATMLEP